MMNNNAPPGILNYVVFAWQVVLMDHYFCFFHGVFFNSD